MICSINSWDWFINIWNSICNWSSISCNIFYNYISRCIRWECSRIIISWYCPTCYRKHITVTSSIWRSCICICTCNSNSYIIISPRCSRICYTTIWIKFIYICYIICSSCTISCIIIYIECPRTICWFCNIKSWLTTSCLPITTWHSNCNVTICPSTWWIWSWIRYTSSCWICCIYTYRSRSRPSCITCPRTIIWTITITSIIWICWFICTRKYWIIRIRRIISNPYCTTCTIYRFIPIGSTSRGISIRTSTISSSCVCIIIISTCIIWR